MVLGWMPQVWDALEAVHAVYEDLKMNQLTWGQLTMVGELAAALAARAGAVEFLDHYARDLSPKWVAEALGHTDVFQNAQPRCVWLHTAVILNPNAVSLYSAIIFYPSSPWSTPATSINRIFPLKSWCVSFSLPFVFAEICPMVVPCGQASTA
jgi:hypothetical protein